MEEKSVQTPHSFPEVIPYNRLVWLEWDVAMLLALPVKKVLLGKNCLMSFLRDTSRIFMSVSA